MCRGDLIWLLLSSPHYQEALLNAYESNQRELGGKNMTPQFLDVLVLALIVSAHITAAQFLHQDADDADEQDEIDLVEKHGRKKEESY